MLRSFFEICERGNLRIRAENSIANHQFDFGVTLLKPANDFANRIMCIRNPKKNLYRPAVILLQPTLQARRSFFISALERLEQRNRRREIPPAAARVQRKSGCGPPL